VERSHPHLDVGHSDVDQVQDPALGRRFARRSQRELTSCGRGVQFADELAAVHSVPPPREERVGAMPVLRR